MEGVIFGLFALSFILLIGMVNQVRAILQPGMSMSKHILKKRAKVLGISGGIILVLAVLLSYM
ncbi:hypothetical protein JOC78_000532 [Bacillus ectoiniformans]|uniref:hypothetical protein n=1 Tax=Bacillus ectoiniformans TaxID=1494429 RepID=UPI001957A5DF|nr:hypothetical protein [Bacillus ectoiniformans]MBM7647611.1 hypothetical protein [Bacillus ectoiniformans]